MRRGMCGTRRDGVGRVALEHGEGGVRDAQVHDALAASTAVRVAEHAHAHVVPALGSRAYEEGKVPGLRVEIRSGIGLERLRVRARVAEHTNATIVSVCSIDNRGKHACHRILLLACL